MLRFAAHASAAGHCRRDTVASTSIRAPAGLCRTLTCGVGSSRVLPPKSSRLECMLWRTCGRAAALANQKRCACLLWYRHRVASCGGMASQAAPMASSAEGGPPHAAAAWEHWRKLGAPKFHVAPMVDQARLGVARRARQPGLSCKRPHHHRPARVAPLACAICASSYRG